MDTLDLWHVIRPWVMSIVVVGFLIHFVRKHQSSLKSKDKSLPTLNSKPAPVSNSQESKRALAIDFTTPQKVSTPEKSKKERKVFSAKASVAVQKKLRELESSSLTVGLENPVFIFYSTLTGTSERIAKGVEEKLIQGCKGSVTLLNVDYIDDLDVYFTSPKIENAARPPVYVFVVPSYETESPLDYFIESLRETYNDFRIDSRPLENIAGFSVFGIGDKESWPEADKFCYQAFQVDKWVGKLGGRRLFPVGTGCVKTDLEDEVKSWVSDLLSTLAENAPLPEAGDIVDSDDESDIEEESKDNAGLMDVEDIGKSINSKKSDTASKEEKLAIKEMVSKDSPTYKALTKQGYTVVGSHSGVKICRWTKSALRGRGSCYKYSFYGIRSHLCMETTPSLSCSNKCVFCWRHGTNPVGTTWRWQVDPPDVIFKGALEGHYKKIKQMRGVPGVVASRFSEAFKARHCALSLVGEPIFYPYINEFVELLHNDKISSFLVCNAQHPDELARLKRVTQLYVSIDAPNKEALKAVDRPLNRDFWERLIKCLDILREKKEQRTVFRLTLVAGYNMEADIISQYADLVARGEPCFIEIKGATYCGTSKGNPLTMKNVPFYQEVKEFVESLNMHLEKRGLEYGIAAEHAHSCCILIAQNRFKIDGVWHTVIDYEKFFKLLEQGADFGPMDYVAPTESWAIYGSEEGGFNPDDVRHRRGKEVKA